MSCDHPSNAPNATPETDTSPASTATHSAAPRRRFDTQSRRTRATARSRRQQARSREDRRPEPPTGHPPCGPNSETSSTPFTTIARPHTGRSPNPNRSPANPSPPHTHAATVPPLLARSSNKPTLLPPARGPSATRWAVEGSVDRKARQLAVDGPPSNASSTIGSPAVVIGELELDGSADRPS
jgi:hypothetical protein